MRTITRGGKSINAIVRIGDYTVERKAGSIRFEEACLEQRTPGHGSVESVGGQGEDDDQNEDGCARVPGGEIRDRKARRVLPTKKHTIVGNNPPNRSRVAANSAANRDLRKRPRSQVSVSESAPRPRAVSKAAAASHCRRSSTRSNIRMNVSTIPSNER